MSLHNNFSVPDAEYLGKAVQKLRGIIVHGDDQDLAGQLCDLLFQLDACFFVKASRRFVQHDKASLAPERPGQVEPALFAAGKGVLLAADLYVHGRADGRGGQLGK